MQILQLDEEEKDDFGMLSREGTGTTIYLRAKANYFTSLFLREGYHDHVISR